MRDSASLVIIPELLNAQAEVRVYDPQGMSEAKKLLQGDIAWCRDSYEAMDKADVVVLLTEWNEFMRLDLEKVKKLMKKPVIVDLRNIYKREEMKKAGVRYISIGRAAV